MLVLAPIIDLPLPPTTTFLNLPRAFDRLLDKVVFAHTFDWFFSLLRGTQSLISQIKDTPAKLHSCAIYLAGKEPLKSALLIDLVAAFERVNLSWLQHILARYGALLWLRNYSYVSWTKQKRTTVPKILNHLAPPIIPLRWSGHGSCLLGFVVLRYN